MTKQEIKAKYRLVRDNGDCSNCCFSETNTCIDAFEELGIWQDELDEVCGRCVRGDYYEEIKEDE